MTRREAREVIFGLIYELEFHKGENYDEIYDLAVLCREFETNEYVVDIYKNFPESLEELDKKIMENSVGWSQERLSKVSLAIMRLSTYEMLYVDSVPYNIAINEAVELAKKFDHDKAPAFINGVLNSIAEKEGLK